MTAPIPPVAPAKPAMPPVAPPPDSGAPTPTPTPSAPVDPKAAWGKQKLVAIGNEKQFGTGKAVAASASQWHYVSKKDEAISKQMFELVEGGPLVAVARAAERASQTTNALKKPLSVSQAILQGEDGATYITSLSASKWGMTYGTPVDGKMLKDVFKGPVQVARLNEGVKAVVGSEDIYLLGDTELGKPVAPTKVADFLRPPEPDLPAPVVDEPNGSVPPGSTTSAPAGGPARAPGEVPVMADETPLPSSTPNSAAAQPDAPTPVNAAPVNATPVSASAPAQPDVPTSAAPAAAPPAG
jgi:hypothetical protein